MSILRFNALKSTIGVWRVTNLIKNQLTAGRPLHRLTYGNLEISDGSTLPKTELTSRYRASFVDEFANMVRKKEEQSAWLPLAE